MTTNLSVINSSKNEKLVVGGCADGQTLPQHTPDHFDQNLINPLCNTGGKSQKDVLGVNFNPENVVMLSDGRNTFPVIVSRPTEGEIASVDYVTLSACVGSYGDKFLGIIDPLERQFALDDLVNNHLNDDLIHIFGFGIAKKRDRGMHFYEYSWELTDNLGMVLAGHKSGRFAIQLNGDGCAYATSGWQIRLSRCIDLVFKRSKLTRLDVCIDDFDGSFISVDWANTQDSLGGFANGGRRPNVTHMGNWKRPNGKGRTLTIGNRDNGKYCRIYEKGRAAGDVNSEWCRAEVEFKAVDRIIPFDALIHPSNYLLGAYKCFEQFEDAITPTKIKTKKNECKILWQKSIINARHQYGKYLNQYRKVYGDKETLDLLTLNKKDMPKRLLPIDVLVRRVPDSEMNTNTSVISTDSDKGFKVGNLITKEDQSCK